MKSDPIPLGHHAILSAKTTKGVYVRNIEVEVISASACNRYYRVKEIVKPYTKHVVTRKELEPMVEEPGNANNFYERLWKKPE